MINGDSMDNMHKAIVISTPDRSLVEKAPSKSLVAGLEQFLARYESEQEHQNRLEGAGKVVRKEVQHQHCDTGERKRQDCEQAGHS